jgi:hypothetical protein
MARDEIRSQEWIDKIEELVRRADSLSDREARGIAVDLLQAVLDLHGAALERMMEIAVESGPVGETIIEKIAQDDLTSSVLMLHDLHPYDLETRIERAIRKLHDVFVSLGAKLTLLAIENGTVRLHFDSARTWTGAPVKVSVEKAIFQAAPEIVDVVIEGLREPPDANFVPLSNLVTGIRA